MKTCPACHQTYEDDSMGFCLNDGVQLVSATGSNLQETLRIPEARATDPAAAQSQETWRAAGPTFTPSAMPAAKPNWLPWILGGAALLILGLAGIVIISAFVFYRMNASSDNTNRTTYNSNRPNANSSSSDSGTRKPGGTSSSAVKESLANTSARSVTDLALPQVGSFKLEGVKSPQGHLFKNEGATELMMATYNRTDGTNFVLLYMASYPTSDSVQKALAEIIRWSVGQGARIQSEEPNMGAGGEQLGKKYVLVNSEGVEDVYWTNGRYAFNAYNGKEETGVLTAFEKAYPY